MEETKNNEPAAIEQIKAALTQVRKSEADMHELAMLLEKEVGNHVDGVRLNKLALGNRAKDSVKLEELYQTFYSAYTIRLLEEYVDILRDRLLLFAVYGILPSYRNLKLKERREKYAQDNPNVKFDRAKTTVSGWSDPNSSLPDYEDKIIKELAKQLDVETNSLGKKLELSAAVFDELEKKFPNGLPEELPSDFPKCIALKEVVSNTSNLPCMPKDDVTKESQTLNALEDSKEAVGPTGISEDGKTIVEPLNDSADNKVHDKSASVVDDNTSVSSHAPKVINSEESQSPDNSEDDEVSVEPPDSLDEVKTINEFSTAPEDKPPGAYPLRIFIKKHQILFGAVALLILAVVTITTIAYAIHSGRKPAHENTSDTSDPESIANEHIVADQGDSDGGRPSYTANEVKYGYLGNQIVFNSINGEYSPGDYKAVYPGDEKDFVRVCRPDTAPDDNDSWESECITVEDAKRYMIKLYISNNNRNEATVAKDTKVALSIPSYSDTQIPVCGYIESSNATPSKIWDGVVFSSDGNKSFHLRFRPDTALFHKDFMSIDGLQLSDDIVSKATEGGTLIGYDDFNGEIPGGSRSAVTAWVDVIYDKYTVISKVRKVGDTEWSEVVDAEIGDQVEFQIEYNNTSTETQNNVMIRDVLPGNLKYVEGTTKLYNANYPNWATLTPDGDIVTRGVNIGSYLGSEDGQGGGNAYIRFTAEVVDTDLACGENFIYNWGQATVDNELIENPSVVIVQKPEQ